MGMEEKYIQQFKKGAYEMVLLSLIAQKETYGYEILTEIQKQGGEIFAFTGEGKDMLEKMKNFWENYKDCVDGFMKGDA